MTTLLEALRGGIPTGYLVATAAEEWIDTPFVWQGRVRGVGCDCRGLVAGVARELGRPEGDSLEAIAGDYGARVDCARLKAGLARLFDKVPERQIGDVLLLRFAGAPQHLAIYAPKPDAPDRIIEAMNTSPCRVRPGRASLGRIDSIWRWR